MANETVGVDINIKTNVAGSIGELKALKKELRETAAGSDEFKKLTNQIDDLEDKLKGSKQAAGDWVDQLASAPGPLGQVGGALNRLKVSTQSFGGALKATGIGLFVAALGGLIAAFAQSERATQKLQPLLIGFQRIFNGIFAAIEPVFDAFIDLATQALPFVTRGFGVAYSAITSFIQGIGTLGQAVGKLIKGDFVGAWDSAKEAVTGFGKRYDDANQRFMAGTKEVTKTEQEQLDKRREQAEKAAEEERKRKEKEAAEELKRLERQAESRKALLQNINAKEEELRKAEKEKQDKEFEKQEQQQLQRTLAAVEKSRLALSTLTDSNIQKSRDQYVNQLNAEGELSNESYKQQLQRYQLTRQLQRQSLVDRKASAAEFAAFDAETKKGEEDREKASAQVKLGIISGALGTIAEAVGQNTIAGKALSIAQATVDTYAGANKALSTYPPPWGAIAAGTVIAAGLLNVRKIITTKLPEVPGSNVKDTATAPSVSTSAPIAPPVQLINTRTQLDSTSIQQLGSATSRSYVLESDVTNSQERIRRINRAARLS
jgi:hypothetical protein